jgi:hypothetical protein
MKLYHPGEIVEGDIKESSQKHFERLDKPVTAVSQEGPTKKELQALCDEAGIPYNVNDNKAKLTELLESATDPE